MNPRRAALAGLVATAVMTALWLVEPQIGLARLAVGNILSSLLAVATAYGSVGPAVGWTIHLVVGVTLALVYAAAFVGRLPGPPITRGLLYGLLIFLLAQLVFVPLVGAGTFSRGDPPMLIGSLMGHLVYGGLIGAIYGRGSRGSRTERSRVRMS
jgi:uncharacterized membrane protein YagU involved in acid resistance